MARIPRARRQSGYGPLLYAKVRRRMEKRTKAQRRTAAVLGHMRVAALSKSVKVELTRQLEVVEDLAREHNVATAKVKNLLYHHRRERVCSVNPWNVHYHLVGVKLNGGMWNY